MRPSNHRSNSEYAPPRERLRVWAGGAGSVWALLLLLKGLDVPAEWWPAAVAGAGGLAVLGAARAVAPLIEILRRGSRPSGSAKGFHEVEQRRKRILVSSIRALGDLGDPSVGGRDAFDER